MENEFVKVFDIADSGFKSIGFGSFGFIFIALGIVYFFSPKILKKLNLYKTEKEPIFKKISRYFFLGFAILWTSLSFYSTYGEYRLLQSSDCKMVEGPVENFDPMPEAGHKNESFSVRGVPFSYSDYVVTSGYNNSASHGGAIQKHSVVRICYVALTNGNAITQLYVKGYQGPILDYSGSLWLFSSINKSKKEKIKNTEIFKEQKMFNNNSIFGQIINFIALILIIDIVLYALFVVPYFRYYFKVKELNSKDIPISSSVLDQEKHNLENMTIKYDGQNTIWARPYGLEILHTAGFALKMTLSADRTKVIKSEIRMSSLMIILLLVFAFLAPQFLSRGMPHSNEETKVLMFFPYIALPLVLISFWIQKRRFEKILEQFF